MSKRYRKGYYFENRVRKFLEDKGYFVIRCSKSKPFDLIAFSQDGVIYFIECKYSGRINKVQRYFQEKIVNDLSKSFNVKYVVVSPKNYKSVFY